MKKIHPDFYASLHVMVHIEMYWSPFSAVSTEEAKQIQQTEIDLLKERQDLGFSNSFKGSQAFIIGVFNQKL